MRNAEIKRKTAETDVSLALELDGTGKSETATGVGFLDHMLTLFSKHSRFDLSVSCKGDIEVDGHHSVEDIGIALGSAFNKAVGDKAGIKRYGSIILPMDEALILCAVDISGRGELRFNVPIPAQKVGGFDTELCEEFFKAFTRTAEITLHLRELDGSNSHHIIEGVFKAFARALGDAASIDPRLMGEVPSTKGVL